MESKRSEKQKLVARGGLSPAAGKPGFGDKRRQDRVGGEETFGHCHQPAGHVWKEGTRVLNLSKLQQRGGGKER